MITPIKCRRCGIEINTPFDNLCVPCMEKRRLTDFPLIKVGAITGATIDEKMVRVGRERMDWFTFFQEIKNTRKVRKKGITGDMSFLELHIYRLYKKYIQL